MVFQNQLLITNRLYFLNLLFQVYPLRFYHFQQYAYHQDRVFGLIKNGNTFVSLAARAFEIIFWATLKREMGL